MKKKPPKEYRLDAVFSKLVRERAENTCERCGNQSRKMDCSHLYGRRMRSSRWAPENAACHCTTCHRELTEKPVLFAEWIVKHLGEERASELRLKAHAQRKRTAAEKRDLLEKMNEEYKRMIKLRAEGVRGRIEFETD